jgi:hypothetical protein
MRLFLSKSKKFPLQQCNFREKRTMRWRETPAVKSGGFQFMSEIVRFSAVFKSDDQKKHFFSAFPRLRQVL